MFSQSDRCFTSSSLLFGGRNDGLVLLITFSSALGPVDRVVLCTLWLDDGLEGDDAAVGEETGDREDESVGAVFADVDSREGVSGPPPEVGVSSWNPGRGGDGGRVFGLTSTEARRDSVVA